jgi:DNA-binding transcriptional LysR family regulator
LHLAETEISIDLLATEALVDLAGGEVDVALRSGPQKTDSGLVIRKLFEDGWSICCSRAYAERYGMPAGETDLASHSIIALPRGFRGAPIAEWLDRAVPESAVVLRSDAIQGLLAGLRSGSGVSLMSDMVAETDANLIHFSSRRSPW